MKKYDKLDRNGNFVTTTGERMKVGDIVKVNKDERIPADMVLLYTTEKTGTVFIRTDQLDGETDWKLRKAIAYTQANTDPNNYATLRKLNGEIVANPPDQQMYDFKGVFEIYDNQRRSSKSKKDRLLMDEGPSKKEALSLENTMWANTILASNGHCLGMVVYTGMESRSQMNSKDASTKVGKLDLEINRLSKMLFVLMIVLSIGIVGL